MKEFLQRIGLLVNMTIDLPIDRSDFVKVLSANIDQPQSDFFDIFSKSKHAYKGTVNYDSFDLKRKRKFGDSGINFTRMHGRFTQKTDRLAVDIELNAFHYSLIPFLVMGVLIYAVLIVGILTGSMLGDESGWVIPFILFHGAFMFGIPYFIMRRGIRAAKYNIERDVFFMMKDKLVASQSNRL